DSVPGRDAVAVLSHAEWQRDFASAADVVGREVFLNGHAFTIIGVAPEEFPGVAPFVEVHIYIPRMMIRQAGIGLDDTPLTNRSVRDVGLLARLKPGVTVDQAKEDIVRIASQLQLERPETNKETRALVWTQFGYVLAGRHGNVVFAVILLSIAFLVLG